MRISSFSTGRLSGITNRMDSSVKIESSFSQAENSSAESRNRVRMVDFIIIVLQFEVEFHAEIGAGIAAYQCVGLVSVRRTVCEQPVYENRNVEPVAVKPFRDFEIDVHTERRETVEIGFFRYVVVDHMLQNTVGCRLGRKRMFL